MAAPVPIPNPLSAGSLAKIMASSLPPNASPQLKTPYDAIALAVHAGMLGVGFKLKGLGEDHKIGNNSLIKSVSQSLTLPQNQKLPTHSHFLRTGMPHHHMPFDTHTLSHPWST
jgi:hypothetical protein